MEPELCFVRTMSRVHRVDFDRFGAHHATDDFAEAIAAVAHRQDFELIVRTNRMPAFGDRLACLASCQRSFELVWND
jgi:hypothetical protein